MKSWIAARKVSSCITLNAAVTNIPNSTTYATIVASLTPACIGITVSNATASAVKIATGAAASEVDQLQVPAGQSVTIPIEIPKGTRISTQALAAANLTTGWVSISFLI